jgi:hypothetical protein
MNATIFIHCSPLNALQEQQFHADNSNLTQGIFAFVCLEFDFCGFSGEGWG